jgi:hypothetical protein
MLLGFAATSLSASVARADDASDARDLFERGRELRAHGDCAGALPLLQKAYALYPSGLGSLRNIAVCQELVGHFVAARDAWAELQRALSGNTSAKYAGWVEDADREIARLTPKLAWLATDLQVVTRSGQPTTDDGVVVTVDDEPLSKDRLGTPIAHDPGTHVARAAGPGIDQPDELSTKLESGDTVRVTLKVTVNAPGGPQAVEPAPALATTESSTGSSSRVTTAGWIAIGVGAASLAGAVASLIERQVALTDMNNTCGNQPGACHAQNEQDAVDEWNRGRTASTLLTVFGVVGLVGVAGGTALVLAGHPHQPQAALWFGPTGVAAKGSF